MEVGGGGGVVFSWETKKKVGLLCLLVKFGISSLEPLDFNTRGLVTHLIGVQKVLAGYTTACYGTFHGFTQFFNMTAVTNLIWHIINSCEFPVTYFSQSVNFKIFS